MDFTPPAADSATGTANSSTSTNKVVINYIDNDQTVTDLYWTATKLGSSDDDDLLEQNEKFEITIGSAAVGSGAGNLVDALGTDLAVNKTFSIEVLTPAGAVLVIERTTPATMDTIMNLH